MSQKFSGVKEVRSDKNYLPSRTTGLHTSIPCRFNMAKTHTWCCTIICYYNSVVSLHYHFCFRLPNESHARKMNSKVNIILTYIIKSNLLWGCSWELSQRESLEPWQKSLPFASIYTFHSCILYTSHSLISSLPQVYQHYVFPFHRRYSSHTRSIHSTFINPPCQFISRSLQVTKSLKRCCIWPPQTLQFIPSLSKDIPNFSCTLALFSSFHHKHLLYISIAWILDLSASFHAHASLEHLSVGMIMLSHSAIFISILTDLPFIILFKVSTAFLPCQLFSHISPTMFLSC